MVTLWVQPCFPHAIYSIIYLYSINIQLSLPKDRGLGQGTWNSPVWLQRPRCGSPWCWAKTWGPGFLTFWFRTKQKCPNINYSSILRRLLVSSFFIRFSGWTMACPGWSIRFHRATWRPDSPHEPRDGLAAETVWPWRTNILISLIINVVYSTIYDLRHLNTSSGSWTKRVGGLLTFTIQGGPLNLRMGYVIKPGSVLETHS